MLQVTYRDASCEVFHKHKTKDDVAILSIKQ